ncbi:hypothetical protein [Pseudomonas kurunegalensis]|uniref:hypothetical protein n=1 Tax=Pseudomonas kurunegalensis TaxID=485880 RepID=UPI003D9A5454
MNTYAYCNGDPVNRIDPTGAAGVRKTVQKKRAPDRWRAPTEINMQSSRNDFLASERPTQLDVITRLINDSKSEPLLFEKKISPFMPRDLENATLHLPDNDPRKIWTSHIAAKAFVKHHDNVMLGNLSYHTDGKLNDDAMFFLGALEDSILRANRPYQQKDTRDYAMPEFKLASNIKRANGIRNALARGQTHFKTYDY